MDAIEGFNRDKIENIYGLKPYDWDLMGDFPAEEEGMEMEKPMFNTPPLKYLGISKRLQRKLRAKVNQ